MRRFVTLISMAALAATVTLTAQKVKTVEDLDKAMKRVGPAQTAVNKAIQATSYGDAKKQLEVIEDGIEDAQNFWVINKKVDGVKMGKDTLAKINALEEALSASTPASAAVTAAFKEVAGSCTACHKTYRTTDENNNFILKPGAI